MSTTLGFSLPGLLAGRYSVNTPPLSESPTKRVWRARDSLLACDVVIKGVYADPESAEARAVLDEFHRLRQLRHPRLPAVFDLGRAHQTPDLNPPPAPFIFFTQEWIEGPSLAALPPDHDPDAILQALLEVLETLSHLHRLGLTHLDLKPEHILHARRGWCLIDLGQAEQDDLLETGGRLFGTLPYLAPEVLGGEPGGRLADLYSVGACFYQVLTGRLPPVPGATVAEIRAALPHLPPLCLPEAVHRQQPRLAAVVERLLARTPGQRPASAELAAKDLEADPADWQHRASLPEAAGLSGQETPWSNATARIDRGLEQGGGLLWIVGPDRSGRTRFLTELALHFQARGDTVLCLPGRICADPPDGTIATVLRAMEAVTASSTASRAASIAPSSPESGSNVPPVSGTSLLAPPRREAHIRQVLSELTRLGQAHRAAGGSTLLLLLDDLHRREELTRAILERWLPYLPEGSGVYLCLATDSVVSPFGASPRAGEDAVAASWDMVQLEPLEPEDITQLASRLGVGTGVTPAAGRHLSTVTRGLAGLVRSALEDLWTGRTRSLETWMPPAMAERGRAVLESLPASSRELTRVASLFECGFTPSILQAVAHRGVIDSDLETLIDRQVLEPVPGIPPSEQKLRFVDASVRRAIRETVPDDEARALHARAAVTLEMMVWQDEDLAAEAARHFLAAGLKERARPHLGHALELCRRAGALDRAEQTLQTLIDTLERSDPHLPRLSVERAEMLLDAGRSRDALTQAEQAEACGPIASDLEERARVVQVRALTKLNRVDEALTRLEALLAGSSDRPPGAGDARFYAWLLAVHLRRQKANLEGARAALEQAGRLVGLPGSRRALEHLEQSLLLELDEGRLTDRRVAEVEQSLARARVAGDEALETRFLMSLARVHRARQRWEGAETALEQALALAKRTFDRGLEARILHNQSLVARDRGLAAVAAERLNRAAMLEQWLGLGASEIHQLDLVRVLLEEGNLLKAEELLATVQARLAGGPPPSESVRRGLARNAVQLHLQRGRTREALESLRAGLEACTGQPRAALEILEEGMTIASRLAQPDRVIALFDAGRRLLNGVLEGDPAWVPVHLQVSQAYAALACRLNGAAREDPTSSPLPQPRASLPDRRHDRWLDLFERMLGLDADEATLAEELAELAGDLLGGQGMVVLEQEGQRRIVRGPASQRIHESAYSRTVTASVRRTGETALLTDILKDERLSSESLMQYGVDSVVCAPIVHRHHIAGYVYADSQGPFLVSEMGARSVVERVATLAGQLLEGLLSRRAGNEPDPPDYGLHDDSEAMKEVRRAMKRRIESPMENLIIRLEGEKGSGKEEVARAIARVRRPGRPFIHVAVGGLPEALLYAQLFGYKKGAFTGAERDTDGLITQAAGGTLFLDEVHRIPLEQQHKLLTWLNKRRYTPLGGVELESRCDIIVAANVSLEGEVKEGRMLADFFDRIDKNFIRIPSLRERGARAIRPLIRQFLMEHLKLLKKWDGVSKEAFRLEDYLTPAALTFALLWEWPANVRGLEKVFLEDCDIETLLLEGRRIDRNDLLKAVSRGSSGSDTPGDMLAAQSSGKAQAGRILRDAALRHQLVDHLATQIPTWTTLQELHDLLVDVRKRNLEISLEENDHNWSKAAAQRDCPRSSLYYNLAHLLPNPPEPRRPPKKPRPGPDSDSSDRKRGASDRKKRYQRETLS